MMKREDYLVWLLIFSTNLMAGAQSTGSFDVQVKAVKSNHSCVDVSWEGADSVQYTVSCNGTRIDQTSSPQRVCRNYQPYSLVQCSVTAAQAGASGTGSGRTACGRPSEPTFTLSNGTMQYDRKPRRRIIVNNLKVENINCGSISEVRVEVYRISAGKFIDLSGSVGLDESHEIDNLDAVTRYRVVVEVKNNGVDNNNNFVTAEQYTTTGELPPGPVSNLISSSSSPKCVDLTWSAPAEPRGTITLYTVNCTGNVRETAIARQITICQFSGYQLVNCSVGAKNEFYGTQTLTSTRTKCDLPSLPQFQLSQNLSADETRREISVYQITTTSNCKSLQQIIIRLYKRSEEISSSDLTQPSVTFSYLDAVTNYTVTVKVVNNENRSSENSISISTGELAPDGPPNRFKLNFNSSCVTLDWSEPLKPNGIILYYMVSCLDQKITLPVKKDENSARYTFCGLPSATQVNCSVSANNSIGWTPAVMSSGYTAPKPNQVPLPAQVTPKPDVLEVKINTVSLTREDLKVLYYQFVVETVESTTRKKRDISAVDVNQLFDAQRAAANGLSYYVAGRISDQRGETIEFTCGDNKMYDGFHNKKLENEVQYKIHYTYTVKLGDANVTYLVESPTSYELETFPVEPFPVYILVIIVIIVILIAIIVTVLVLYKKNVISCKCMKTQRNGGLHEDTRETQLNIINPQSTRVSGEDSPDNIIPDAYEDVSHITPQTPLLQMSLPVSPPGEEEHATPVRTMNEKLIEYRSKPIRSVIYYEFQTIEKKLRNLQHDYSNGRKHCNMLKNADPDILPDEFSRVVLVEESNDYINAIVLGSFKKRSEFIVTQTPLQETVSDFWLMVHEQKIINVIQLQDSNMAYIPANDGESLTFDEFKIRRVQTQNEASVDKIQLVMSPPHTTNKKQKVEEITVFRYLDWNEENIPNKQSLVDLYLIIKRNTRQKYRSPALIMCRNGATKCGVYVNMYSILEKVELEQIVDVYKSVLKTRSRRPQFISDIESYADLYEIVQTFANYYSQYSNFR